MPNKKAVGSLVIGANGLVGRKICTSLKKEGIDYIGTFNKRPKEGLFKLDITNPEELKDIFSRFSPEAVFNCANLAGGVNFCEKNPAMAKDFHLKATENIGTLCKDIDAAFIFVSTDYVFDGTNGPYKEDSPTNPLNLYGRLKLETEEWIRENLTKYLIIRTTNIYGWDPETVTPNYIMSLYRTLKDKKVFNAPSFLWGNPTYAEDLAEAITELLAKRSYGVFHVVGSSFINRFEWARQACKILQLDGSLVNEIKEPSPNDKIPRPLRSNLNTDKFRKSHKTVLHDVTEGLTLMRSSMDAENRDLLDESLKI